jgi:hypothetical protein
MKNLFYFAIVIWMYLFTSCSDKNITTHEELKPDSDPVVVTVNKSRAMWVSYDPIARSSKGHSILPQPQAHKVLSVIHGI